MLPFSPLLLSNALLEGLSSISTLILKNDREAVNAVRKFLFHPTELFHPTDCEENSFIECYNAKKSELNELLKRADNGSINYKRFSFIIQLLWEYMNPKLNPFFYKDGTFEKGLSAFLISTGVSTLEIEHETWNYCVGGNLATTKGYVVFENEIMQLLYYPGLNEKIKEKPVFIVPPWINKYYIFDLSKNNSYIGWLTRKIFLFIVFRGLMQTVHFLSKVWQIMC